MILHEDTMTELSLVDVSKPLLALIAGPYLSGLECCDAVLQIPGESHGAGQLHERG
jgi:hypothetical protein